MTGPFFPECALCGTDDLSPEGAPEAFCHGCRHWVCTDCDAAPMEALFGGHVLADHLASLDSARIDPMQQLHSPPLTSPYITCYP